MTNGEFYAMWCLACVVLACAAVKIYEEIIIAVKKEREECAKMLDAAYPHLAAAIRGRTEGA